jgi:twinkle protein
MGRTRVEKRGPARQYPGKNRKAERLTGFAYTEPLQDDQIDWFKQRGINEETLRSAGVESGTRINGSMGPIAFVHKNSDGETINVKFRAAGKKFSQTKNGARLPYLWSLVDTTKDRLIIVEGEVDSLSVHECGIANCISVPDGASDRKMSWLEELSDEIDKFKRIILFTDFDRAGLGLRDELSRRLGVARCFRIESSAMPSGCKDANDVLTQHGDEVLKSLIDGARPVPMRALRETRSFAADALRLLHGEIKQGLSTGIGAFDGEGEPDAGIYRVRPGELTVISGVPSSGKSEILDLLLVQLGIKHGWSFAVCSFENEVDEHLNKLAAKHQRLPAWGPDRMDDEKFIESLDWCDEHFYWIRAEDDAPTVEWCLNTATAAVARYPNLRGLVLDPWNEFSHRRPNAMTETEYVGQALGTIKRWAAQNGCHVWLVAHPAKVRRNYDGSTSPLDGYSISGSANFYNKADCLLLVERDFTAGSRDVRVHVKKIRHRAAGQVGVIELNYDRSCGVYS